MAFPPVLALLQQYCSWLRLPRRVQLRTALVVPFVVQIGVTGGVLMGLSFIQGQRAIASLSQKLLSEIDRRIERELDTYLDTPRRVQEMNLQAIEAGLWQPEDLDTTAQIFWQQVSTFQLLDIGYGTADRRYVSAGYSRNRPDISQIDSANPHQWRSFQPDQLGQPLTSPSPPNPLDHDAQAVFEEPWFQEAVQHQKSLWTRPYAWESETEQMSLDLTSPIYWPDGRLRGVLATSLGLRNLTQFLRDLALEKHAKAFIIDRSGNLLAHSLDRSPYDVTADGVAQLTSAVTSPDPLIAEAAQYLLSPHDRSSRLATLSQDQTLESHQTFQRLFILVNIYQDKYGLDWAIVTVVPEQDFLGSILVQTQHTLWISLFCLLGAIGVGLLTARWITQGMANLTQATRHLAQGDLTQTIALNQPIQVVELENLAWAFNHMARQLNQSFQTLEAQKNAFARFFPQEFFHFLGKDNVVDIQLGDSTRAELTLLFSDIRNFTERSEHLSPQENFEFVNAYLHHISPEIRNHRGFVLKFIGDGLMAVFPHQADDAIAAALAQFEQLTQFNQQLHHQGLAPLKLGMGIHTGPVMLGTLGEPHRLQGDVISAQVNFAARLEGLTKYLGASLLISEQTRCALMQPEAYALRFLGRVQVKGLSQFMPIYEVLAAEVDPLQRALKTQTAEDLRQGIEGFIHQNFRMAQAQFEAVLAQNPDDRCARLYLDYLAEIHGQGETSLHESQGIEPWRGVLKFHGK